MKALAALLVLFFSPLLLQAEPLTPPDLAKIDHFAFGGVGFVGSTSAGELAFRKVMAEKAPRDHFLQLLETGTPAAQCYALVGLRLLDLPAFAENATRFKTDERQVETIGGCMISKEPMRSVVANIERGRYDEQAKHPRRER